MKKPRSKLAILTLLFLWQQPVFAAQQRWQVTEQTDPMYGGKTVILKLYADNSGDSLVIQCHRKKTQVAYGIWAGALPVGDRVPILVKLDQAKPKRESWLYDPSGWYRSANPIGLARKLFHTQHLILEYQPAIGSAQLDQFTLAGIDTLLPKVATACAWKMP